MQSQSMYGFPCSTKCRRSFEPCQRSGYWRTVVRGFFQRIADIHDWPVGVRHGWDFHERSTVGGTAGATDPIAVAVIVPIYNTYTDKSGILYNIIIGFGYVVQWNWDGTTLSLTPGFGHIASSKRIGTPRVCSSDSEQCQRQSRG